MKAAVIQQAARTTNGTQDWTDASVISDLKGAIFFASQATVNDTNTAQFRPLMGATDLSGNIHQTYGTMADGSTGASAQMWADNTGSLMQTNVSPIITMKAVYSATLSNGVTMNYTTAATAFLENAVLLSGSDIEFKVSSTSFISTDTSKTVTHGLSGKPDIVIIQCAVGLSAFGAGSSTNSIVGVWERGGTTAAGLGIRQLHAANPTDLEAIITTDMGHAPGAAGSDAFTMSLASVGNTTMNVVRSLSGSVAMQVTIISIRGTTNALVGKCGVFNTPTSTGNSVAVSGMSIAPQVLFLFGTRMTTSGSVLTDDSTGSFGLAWSANNGGVTNQMSSASTAKDNVATSVAKCQTSATKALRILDNTGAATVDATISTWDSGGVTLNYSAVNASALKVGYLAFGSVPAALVYIPRRTIRSISPVYIPQSF